MVKTYKPVNESDLKALFSRLFFILKIVNEK